jgi:hypothetical protein
MRTLALTLVVLLAVACSRDDAGARERVLALEDASRAAAVPRLDPEHPQASLALSADDVARAIGSFEWTGAVEWTVTRSGADAVRVHATERHAIRQLATGEFEAKVELDPDLGPGAETGRHVIFAGGMTYGRALPAAFRERPTDRGRDARRFRDESFGLARSLAELYGPALRLEPAGDTTLAGRRARRFRLALARGATSPPAAAPGDSADADTKARRLFLDGRVPSAVDGEVLLDAQTGAPLLVRLAGAFDVKDAPGVHTTVQLLAQVKAVGAGVAAVTPPKVALPDERKPAGPSTALEAAGLKKRGDDKGRAEPSDEPE